MEVQALYTAAGLSLAADLFVLKSAARVAVNPTAEQYVIQNIVYNGQLPIPVLTLHNVGDGLVTPENEKAYLTAAKKAGDQAPLRDLFVHRAGHCVFTPAETVTALKTLTNRIATGKWKGLSPSSLDSAANHLGPSMNVLDINNQFVYTPPQFVNFNAPQFLRPFDAFSQ